MRIPPPIKKNVLRAVMLLAIGQCLAFTCTRSGEDPLPNIVLIVVDDLGWKDVGFMGSKYYETPNLDALSRESFVFRQAYAGAANCAPSRACLLSGQNTPRHGIYTVASSERGNKKTRKLIPTPNIETLADSVVTLAEVLQAGGYTTCSIGKWHIGDDPRTQGFDINVAGTHGGHPRTYFSPYQNKALPDGPDGEYLTDRLATEAVNFIHEHQQAPFFLYMPFFSIHTPLQGKPELVEKYQNKPPLDGQGNNPNYSAMVETMDAAIGRVLHTLDSLGLAENTIFLMTSDNGGISYLSRQTPLRAGKGSYYEGGIRVPLLLRWPGHIPAGKVSEAPVTQMDIFPTLMELLGQQLPKDKLLDGMSLKDHLVNGKAVAERPLYWHFPIYLEAYRKGEDESRDSLFRTRPGTAMRLGDWKLHEYFEDGAWELYNLANDPGELKDLSTTETAKLAEMQTMMRTWRESVQAPVPTALNPGYDPDFRPQ